MTSPVIVTVLAATLCLPFLRNVGWLGDEGIWLDAVDRMLRGEHLYTDFFEFHPPGAFLLVDGWFHLAGSSFLSERILTTMTVAGTACFTFLACVITSESIALSAAAALAWVMLSLLEWSLQLGHHSFTTLFATVSAWAALRSSQPGLKSRPMPLVSGLMAGAAVVVTPPRGVLAVLASMTAFVGPGWSWLNFIKFAAGCVAVPALLLGLIVFEGSAAAAFADVIVFPALHYSSIQIVPFGAGPRSSLLKYAYPVIALMFALICVLDWRRVSRDRVLWTSLALALAGVLGAYPRPDLVHIGFSLPLSLPLAMCCATILTRRLHPMMVYAAFTLAILVCLPSTFRFYRGAKQALTTNLTQTPRGNVAFQEDGAADLVNQLNSESGTYFFYPYIPMLPYLTAKPQTSKYDVFVPHYTTIQQYGEACISLINSSASVVINTKWNDQDFLQSIYPAMTTAKDENKEAFDRALRAGFKVSWQKGEFQILRRSLDAPDYKCPTQP